MAGAKETTYIAPKCAYTIQGDQIKTDGSIKNKVTGTSMAGILGCSPWSSPFQAACALLGLGREDISNKPAVKTGIILESPIIDYADKKWNDSTGMFLKADEVFSKRTGDHDSWKSDFEDEMFAGHVDGIVMGKDGKEYVLEVKTASKDRIDDWVGENGYKVPEHYFWQVALYNHFICKQDKAYVVVGFVNEYTHRDPYGFWERIGICIDKDVLMEDIQKIEMPIDDAIVAQKMDEIANWYNEYIANGITPKYDPSNPGDVMLFEHLCDLANSESDMCSTLDRISTLRQAIKEHEASKDDLYTEVKLLEGNLKEFMIARGISQVESMNGDVIATIGIRESRSLKDTELSEVLIAKGLNLNDFYETKQINTLTIKKAKKK